MLEQLTQFFATKNILILGFGVEGRSTYKLIRRLCPDMNLVIADADEKLANFEITLNDTKCSFKIGENYLEDLIDFDLIIKSPGISLKNISICDTSKFTSHTELFFRFFRDQIVGITGTKGKSTTSSLIFYVLKQYTANCILVGNIGTPPFEMIDSIDNETLIVYELSSHQLEQTHISPHIAILLNLYQEHLDHYQSFEKYQEAKFNVTLNQQNEDYFIYNADDVLIDQWIKKKNLKRNYIPYSLSFGSDRICFIRNSDLFYSIGKPEIISNTIELSNLQGEHNLLNIMAAVCASKIIGVPNEIIREAIKSFKPLDHRIEYVGVFNDIVFYNDSISTIPEATIAAIKALKVVDTVILGGFDRGIYYDDLIDFIQKSEVRNIVFIDKAGQRMLEIYNSKKYSGKFIFCTNTFIDAVAHAKEMTAKNKICLLSPAAASYGMFKNFAERGATFKQLVKS